MTTRPYPLPRRSRGPVLHHATDVHSGARDFIGGWMAKHATQMKLLQHFHDGHVITGDLIHNIPNSMETDDAAYLAWRNGIKATDGKPIAEAFGNHDAVHQVAGAQVDRTALQWAAKYGYQSQNYVTQMGELKVITIGPDTWPWGDDPEPNQSTLSPATLTWLDQQLTAAGTNTCVIASHVPPQEQFTSSGASSIQNPSADVAAVVGAHSNIGMWLSGHLHVYVSNGPAVKVVNIGGKNIFCVNGPPAGGGRPGAVAYADHQWNGGVNNSSLVQYLGDAIEVTWLDHNALSFANDGYGGGNGSGRMRRVVMP